VEEIGKFISGFRRFQHKYFGEHQSLFNKLKQKQTPKTLMIGCSDSRVDPAILTDCDPGDLFIVERTSEVKIYFHFRESDYNKRVNTAYCKKYCQSGSSL
jgi:hypothetical protein